LNQSGVYEPSYAASHALVIGINKYANAPPLVHACNDAEAIAHTLISRFDFPQQHLTLLLDRDATKQAISDAFLNYEKTTLPNDRLLVFFAGHGHTVSGRRADAGFLVPANGNVSNLASLIRWDELTRNGDIIPAKHLFFLMDACYGGLALTRKTVPPGSMRFLRNMLQRYSRQVLTAGKGDEIVSDGGGTRKGHSIFTSHLLDAFDEIAGTPDGITSASALMAYVHRSVSQDTNSDQTPHYGYVDGDGDFILDIAPLKQLAEDEATGRDLLIKTIALEPVAATVSETSVEKTKRLMAHPTERIQLDDFITRSLRECIRAVGPERFPVQGGPINASNFAARLKKYEEAVAEIKDVSIVLGRWANDEQVQLLNLISSRIAEVASVTSGRVVWLELQWYPSLLLMYATGIAALASNRFDILRQSFLAQVISDKISRDRFPSVILPVMGAATELHDAFKLLPGYERNYTPRSEYLFKMLQPALEDQLFLGRSYERLFDKFEILTALVYADLTTTRVVDGDVWGPPGRFAWKHTGRFSESSPYSELLDEARKARDKWGPLRAGLFDGSYDRFQEVSDAYAKRLARIAW
jgi:hypothetical protein